MKRFRVVVPLRRMGHVVISNPDAGFGVDDANTSIELLSGLPREHLLNVSSADAPPYRVLVDVEMSDSRIVNIEITRTVLDPSQPARGVELPIQDAVHELLGAITRELAVARPDSFAALIKTASLLEAEVPGASRELVRA